VLLLKSLGGDNPLEFELMDVPPQDNILHSLYELWMLGAIDNSGLLTSIGREMVELPLDPPLSKMVVMGSKLECNSEILTIVSMLSVQNIFFRPSERNDKNAETEAAREKLLIPESDHLTVLNVYQQWQAHQYSSDWSAKHFLQQKSLQKVREVRS
jgi:pre-mRNA-splicing factor ATP-dependent RNA helicase DHX38/PRP16